MQTQANLWILATRPKTLIASLSPVLIGSSLAYAYTSFSFQIFWVTLFAALAIQIGTNLANDYFDAKKGADTRARKGPLRLTASGLISKEHMKVSVFITFSLAALLSCFLIMRGGLPIALLASLSILLGIIYTAGPYALAYLGLGDLFVITFFGPVATLGTFFLQTHEVSWSALVAGVGPGLLSTAILTINNLRDAEEDALVGKKTLAVRLGKSFTRCQYAALILLACLTQLPWTLVLLLPAAVLVRGAWKMEGEALNLLLAQTGALLWLYTLLFTSTALLL